MIRVTREDYVLTASERFAIEEAISECSTKKFENQEYLGLNLCADDRADIRECAVELWKAMPALLGDAKTFCMAIIDPSLDVSFKSQTAASILLDAIEKFEGGHR